MERSNGTSTSPTKRNVVVTKDARTVDQILDENQSPLSYRLQPDGLPRKEESDLAHYFVSLSFRLMSVSGLTVC
jgi:hypothetical protein